MFSSWRHTIAHCDNVQWWKHLPLSLR